MYRKTWRHEKNSNSGSFARACHWPETDFCRLCQKSIERTQFLGLPRTYEKIIATFENSSLLAKNVLELKLLEGSQLLLRKVIDMFV